MGPVGSRARELILTLNAFPSPLIRKRIIGSARITSMSFTEGGTPGGRGTLAPISERPRSG